MLLVRYGFPTLLALLLLALPCPAQTPEVTVESARILDYGIFSSDISAFILDEGVADHSKIVSRDFSLIEPTADVKARLGTGFGIKYVVLGQPCGDEVEVDVTVEHPPLFNPKSGKTYLFSRTKFKQRLGRPGHAIWTFDEGWTLCPGKWVIRVEYRGRLLAKQEFAVTLAH